MPTSTEPSPQATAATKPPPTHITSRAFQIWQRGGTAYLIHKALRRTPGRWAQSKRRLLYNDPRHYWTLRGGDDYFREQEDHPTRSLRLSWVADRVASYAPTSVLEVGCGYGKLLGLLRQRTKVDLVGVDFSPTQLGQARAHLADRQGIELVLASGCRLPFPDRSFDLVITSAVILHNPPKVAQRIREEIVRVGRRWAAHNEDTNITYNRFGYDTAAWYRGRGIGLSECGPISSLPEPEREDSQFCVAELWRA